MEKITMILLVTVFVTFFGSTSSQGKPDNDSSLILFGDKNYRINLHVFDAGELDESKNNATLTFIRIHGADTTRLLFDSLYCLSGEMKLVDFNNDGTNDVTVFHSSGARSNPTFYLYIVNSSKHSLICVHGFEELPNQVMDKKNKIKKSRTLSVKINKTIYKKDSKNRLINIGHACEDDVGDAKNYEKAMKEIRRSNNLIKHKRKV